MPGKINSRMQQIHPIELLMKVRYMMEYMTLCADPTLFANINIMSPKPNGVPMGITVLPEFVIDVNTHLMKDTANLKTTEWDARPIDIGGRAGRLVWLLYAFIHRHNCLYNINYVTKVSKLGRFILEDRFFVNIDNKYYDPLPLNFVFHHSGLDWIAIYEDTSRIKESAYSISSVNKEDIEKSYFSSKDIFQETRYIVISSKYTKHAQNALAIIEDGLTYKSNSYETNNNQKTKLPIGLLLDLSALNNKEDINTLLNDFNRIKNKLKVNYNLYNTILGDTRHKNIELSLDKFDHFIINDTNSLIVKYGNKQQQFETGHVDLTSPMSREAFTAGYVIASACEMAGDSFVHGRRIFLISDQSTIQPMILILKK